MGEIETPAQAERDAAAQGRVHTIRLWLKSFIPYDLEGAQKVPEGAHAGKTMLPTPGPINAWFLTDQRKFSDDIDANSRMHSEITLDMLNFTVIAELHKCDPTIQVDHETGSVVCEETAGTDDMHFDPVNFSPDAKRVELHLHGSTKNACLKLGPVKISPNLDYEIDIVAFLSDGGREVTLTVKGAVETYPAFEMYASVNDGPAATVFQVEVEPGATPLSLNGPAARPVQATITLSA